MLLKKVLFFGLWSRKLNTRVPLNRVRFLKPVGSPMIPRRSLHSQTHPDLFKWRARMSGILVSSGVAYMAWKYYTTTPVEASAGLPTTSLLSFDQVDKIMRANARVLEPSSTVTQHSHVVRIDVNSVASNSPIEDTQGHSQFRDGLIVGVYDGHGGTECSALISTYLTSYVSRELEKLPPLLTSSGSIERVESVKEALSKAFVSFDNDLLNASFSTTQESWWSWSNSLDYGQVLKDLKNALAGSCALVSYIEGSDVYVACTGDCRAVMGRKMVFNANGVEKTVYKPLRLSQDQTHKNTHEYQRMISEHPGEEKTVISRGRVLGGLMPTRAFGDAVYKWPADILESILPHVYPGGRRRVKSNYKTPPYVTARPEVVHYTRNSTDSFLVMATDGLWDELTDEEAVSVVGQIVEKEQSSNAATNLIKAALGGYRDPNHMRHLLSLPAPVSRDFRDDITVNVIFFDEVGLNGLGSREPIPMATPKLANSKSSRLDELVAFLRSKPLPSTPKL